MSDRRDLEEEQAFLDLALASLEAMRAEAAGLRDAVLDLGRGGTFQSRTERDIVVRTSMARLQQLDIGDQALCFGRIDAMPEPGTSVGEAFHIGRVAVSGAEGDPLVVDWRAPVAEPFYQATGRDPRGLARRRHLHIKGPTVLGVEDEYFADDAGQLHLADGSTEAATGPDGLLDGGHALGGPAALLAALGRARSGQMGDIVATIQAEQDEIIRAPLSGVLMVQGGPGTGKTAVALHRAAYLLYTHRFPLERQGVLVVGPNPLFLRYIDQVLPSLGETGVTLSTIAGLVPEIRVTGSEPAEVAKLKGAPVMAKVLARAVRSRQRTLRAPVEVPLGATVLRLSVEESEELIGRARRRPGVHNLRRRFVETEVVRVLARQFQARRGLDDAELDLREFTGQLRRVPEFQQLLDRLWPRLSAHELLHDLFGSLPLLRVAGRNLLSDDQLLLLHRPRSTALEQVAWTPADAALVDEARTLLGPRRTGQPKPRARAGAEAGWPEGLDGRSSREGELDAEEQRSFGHIVVDEVQDLSPMQLRMLQRRSLSGSMTVVGDIAQATGPWSLPSWDEIAGHLTPRRPARLVELTVSYRTPAEVLELAAEVLAVAAPEIDPPRPVRRAGVRPVALQVDPGDLIDAVLDAAQAEVAAIGDGRVAVLAPLELLPALSTRALERSLNVVDPRLDAAGLSAPLVLLAVDEANGLEFDAVVVVEPGSIATRGSELDGGARTASTTRGLRTLYVALTRPTRRLAVVSSATAPIDLSPWLVERRAILQSLELPQ